jgi:polyribonucleotide 5'-hydroxyl-kinase
VAQVAYVSDSTPMVSYLNTHIALEHRRDQAAETKSSGPRVVVVGPHDVGKSTISQMLVNWAVRRQRRPLYVDLDVGQGALAVPGVLGAALLDRPMDVTEGLATTTPLVYHYGHVSPEQNTALFKRLVSTLATRLEKRCVIDESVRTAGYIVNTTGWVDGQGVQLLHHVIEALSADVVLVVDHERLFNELKAWAKARPNTNTTVLRVAKSGGVVTRTQEFRFAERSRQIRKYFYGVTTKKDGRIVASTLYPHVTQLRFDHVHFFKIGGMHSGIHI